MCGLDDFRLHDTVPRGQEEPYSMLPSPTAALGTGLSSPLAHHALLPSKQQQYYRHPREKNGNPSIYGTLHVTKIASRSMVDLMLQRLRCKTRFLML